MSEFFITIVNRSISASWMVAAVLLLRLLLKKAPKWISVLLWGIVAVRLVCPFSIKSVMSLIPSAQTISPEIMTTQTPQINTGIPVINNTMNPIINELMSPAPEASVNPLQIWIPMLAAVWVIGMAILLIYTVISYWRVRRRIGTAVLLRDNIFQSENVVSPFVLGVCKPKIYLPFRLHEQDAAYVIAHEQAHIRRKDHLWKPFGFLLLTLHWFNPLMWLGYGLLCRDIELACDEKVIKDLNTQQKADYSQALLNCSVNRRMIAACPLAFGEVGVKDRVKSVLNYKKPAFWVIIVSILASIAVAGCFLTNPRTVISDELSAYIDRLICEQHYAAGYTDNHFVAVHHKVLDADSSSGETTVYMWVLYQEYSCKDATIQLESGAHIPTVITVKHAGTHGQYELVEYWEPRDGSYYAEDIRAKFPAHLYDKALDSQRYIDEQLTFCDRSAEEYYLAASKTEDNGASSHTASGPDSLKAKYPQFFDLSTDGGLTVYVWQMAQNNYQCYLANTSVEALSDQSFVLTVGTTMDEMRTILSTYSIGEKDITIQPIVNPASSYFYTIDNEYCEKVRNLFWGRTRNKQTSETSSIIHHAALDTDNDKKDTQSTSGDDQPLIAKGDNRLYTAISAVLQDRYHSDLPDGFVHMQSYHLLAMNRASGTPKAGDTGHRREITVYLIVFHAQYKGFEMIEDGEKQLTPAAITFSVGKSGDYTLKEYWTPSTGADYERDVRATFPKTVADDALPIEKYEEALKKDNMEQLSAYLNAF